jgi:hypothetical protein
MLRQEPKDYERLEQGALRRLPLTVSAPALVRQVGYWIPDASEREQWIQNIERTICYIYDTLDKVGKVTGLASKNRKKAGDLMLFRHIYTDKYEIRAPASDNTVKGYRTAIIRFDFLGLSFQYIINLHFEYITITTTMEIRDDKNLDGTLKKALINKFKKLESVLAKRAEVLNVSGWPPPLVNAQRKSLCEIYDFLYNKAWKRFDIFFNNVCPESENYYKEIISTKTIFYDTRGIVGQHTGQFGDFILIPPNPKTSSAANLRSAPYDNDDTHQLSQLLNDFMKSGEPEYSKAKAIPQERIVCGVLDGRCLYASSLSGNLCEEVRYQSWIILSTHNNWFQLGGLIDMICSLEALRLAAIQDLSAYSAANKLIEYLFKKYTDDNMLDDIALSKDVRSIGGRLYRTSMAFYYYTVHEKLIAYLRIRRIEGFQPYDQFIARRSKPILEYILMIGRRSETFLDLVHSQLSAKCNAKILELNLMAEIVTFFLLIPYYGGSVLCHLGLFEDKQCFVVAAILGPLAFCWKKFRRNSLRPAVSWRGGRPMDFSWKARRASRIGRQPRGD